MTWSPGLVGATIISAPGLTAKTVIALDAADFVSGEGDKPRFDLSDQSVIHQEDTPPLASAPRVAQCGGDPDGLHVPNGPDLDAHDLARGLGDAPHRARGLHHHHVTW